MVLVATHLRLSFSRFRHSCHRSTAISCLLDRAPKGCPHRFHHGSPCTPLRPLGRGRCAHPAPPFLVSRLQEREDCPLRPHPRLDACPPAVPPSPQPECRAELVRSDMPLRSR